MKSKIEKFGNYILLKKIASGGMAEVYLAKKTGAEGIVKFLAIKKILPQYSKDKSFINMFKSEANIAVNLFHKNIVTIHECELENNQIYLAMDFVSGISLRQLIKDLKKTKKTIPIKYLTYIIKETAEGLYHAHNGLNAKTGESLNIIHRDISPQNILISFNGEVKLIDFGIAKSTSINLENTQTGILKGKIGYMSPEQAKGESLSFKTDIFSLGIILWEIISGERLFLGSNEINTIKNIIGKAIPSLTKKNPLTPEQLEKICLKTLERDPKNRHSSCLELIKDLQLFLNTNYPKFSSQDFSNFIKRQYSQQILKIQKELIYYANLKANANNKNTADNSSYFTLNKESSESVNLREDKLTIDKEGSVNATDYSKNPQQSSSSNNSLKSNRLFKSHSMAITSTNRKRQLIIEEEKAFKPVTAFWSLVLLVVIGSGFYMFQNESYLKEVQNILEEIRKEEIAIKEEAKKRQPSSEIKERKYNPNLTKIFIESEPSGASIWIDGKKTNYFTPYSLMKKKYSHKQIVLKKSHFKDYLIDWKNLDYLKISAQMIPQKQGFLSIHLIPERIQAQIFINGKEQLEKSKKYKLPSGQLNSLLIKSKNSLFSKKVKVSPNETKKIYLFYDKEKRTFKEK